MLIQITNTCLMNCPHCMECSSPAHQHMDDATVDAAFAFCERAKANVILISGGEPTLHPKWSGIVDRFANRFFQVVIPSNGSWIGTDREQTMFEILTRHDNVTIQVTSFQDLYKDYSDIIEKVRLFCLRLSKEGMKHRVALETNRSTIHMVELGRAAEVERFREEARNDESSTTSCFASALVGAQVPFEQAVENLEMRGKFCHPLIDWQGNMHWSESWLCPSFANITEPYETIVEKAHAWRPCGKCPGYRKLLAKRDMRYGMAKKILGIMA